MNRMAHWLRRYLRDSIVVRVCLFIYGAIFGALGCGLAYAFVPPHSFEWLAVLLGLAMAGLGAFMLYTSTLGRLQLLERTSDFVSDGGEVLGIFLLLLVFVVALPIAAVIKFIRSPRWRP